MPSTATKRQIVEQAYAECAVNGWALDITPEEKSLALTRLDMLMNELAGRGLDLNYNFPTGIGTGDLDDTLGCDDQAFYGLAVLLAERLAPTMGKTQSAASRQALHDAMKAVRAMAKTLVPTVAFVSGTPRGSGNKPWSIARPFVEPTVPVTTTGLDGGSA